MTSQASKSIGTYLFITSPKINIPGSGTLYDIPTTTPSFYTIVLSYNTSIMWSSVVNNAIIAFGTAIMAATQVAAVYGDCTGQGQGNCQLQLSGRDLSK